MQDFRVASNIRTEADIRNAVYSEILLSVADEAGDGAIVWLLSHGSLVVNQNDLKQDSGLWTAVTISLFTDARADDDDILPGSETDRRGFWADCLNEDGEETGSKLWLLHREKQTREVLNRAEEYSLSALRWLVEDKVASKVDVQASYIRRGWLYLEVDITRPGQATANYKYEYNWLAHERAMGA